jgi:hypothetical protein
VDASLSQFSLRLALIVATLAAVAVITGVFSDTVRYVCVGIVALAAVLTIGERRRAGGGWWTLFAAGAGLSIVGAAAAELNDTVGGLIAVIGGALVVIGATVGFPADGSARD